MNVSESTHLAHKILSTDEKYTFYMNGDCKKHEQYSSDPCKYFSLISKKNEKNKLSNVAVIYA